jgi:flagellar motor switch protein FliG
VAVVNAQKPLSGARKAAIVLMALGEESSARLISHLEEREIERIAREVASIVNVTPEVGEAVLGEFHEMTAATDHIGLGGLDHARRLLSKSLGAEQARRILDRVAQTFATNAGFQTLEKANPQQLSKFILGEHPQTIALVLAHLNAYSAAQLVAQLPDEMRADVLVRMASIEDISPDIIGRISSVIDQRLKSLGGPTREQHGGLRAVAELFNRLDRSVSQATLERIESQSQDLAVQIRNLMFVFEDLTTVDDAGIREIVNRADKKILTVAMKGASEEIRGRFFGNMSKRAAELIKEDMEIMGAVRLRDVEKAQQEMVAIARKLEEEGLITTGAGAGEPYVV